MLTHLSQLNKESKYFPLKVKILGTQIQSVIDSEDRKLFAEKVSEIGEKVAPSAIAENIEEALGHARDIGYPVLARAAYALGGLGSGFADNPEQVFREISSKVFQIGMYTMFG